MPYWPLGLPWITRARALKHGKHAARDLRAELVNLGVVVRDESGKQYWRRADRPVES